MTTSAVTASGKAGGPIPGAPPLKRGQVYVRMTLDVTAVFEQDTEAEWVKFFGVALFQHGLRLTNREIYPPPPPAHEVEKERTYPLMIYVDGVEHLVPVNVAFSTRKTVGCGIVEEAGEALGKDG